jgi:ferritin-like metal-binding protein YciE
MSEAIIVALITGGLSLVGIIITSVRSNQQLFAKLDKQSELSDAKLDAKLERHQAVTDTKIEELTRKVERHNNMIERTYQLEGRMNEAEHDIKDLKGRVA